MSSQGTRKLSRAQKRRAAARRKKEAAAAAARAAAAAEAAAAAARNAPTPAQAQPKPAPVQQQAKPAWGQKARQPVVQPKVEQAPPKVEVAPAPVKQQKVAAQLSQMTLEKKADDGAVVEDFIPPLQEKELVPRMKPGTTGRPIVVVTNTFPVNFTAKQIFRYVVEFEPEIAPERIRQRRLVLGRFGSELRKLFGYYIFDGTCFFTLKRERNTNLTAQDGSSSIHIRFTNSINTDNALSQEVNMVVNNMTKKKLRSLKLISFARSYYYPDPKPVRVRYNDRTPEDQKFQLQMYKGFMATVQPSLRGMIMTVDLTSRIMQQESIRDQLTRYEMEARRQHMSKSQYMAKMQEIYTGAVVLAQYNRRIWRIDEIDFSKNINSEFEKKDGSKISFKQYYSETYSEVKQKIMNVQPKPGLLVNRPKKARTTKQETILLPELCYLTGVTDLMRKNNSLMKALADVTRMSPNQRVKDITELMGSVMKNSPPPPGKEPLPIQIGSKPIEVKGRVLGPFNIVMPRNKKRLDDNKGFANDVRSCGFFGGRPSVRSWGCIFDKADQRTAQQVIANIQQIGNQQGAQIARGIPLAIQGPAKDVKSWGMAIQKMMTKKPEFILIIVPRTQAKSLPAPLISPTRASLTTTRSKLVSF